eukprot:191221-Alexandrium_andersonii.AAC.1
MFAILLVSVPWIKSVLDVAPMCIPRVLADDFQLTTIPSDDCHDDVVFDEHVAAVDATCAFVCAVGAKLSTQKCKQLATTPRLRAMLRAHVYPAVDMKFGVVQDVRDLGAHLSLSSNMKGTTMSARMDEACKVLESMSHMPLPIQRKLQVIKGKVLPMGLYACSATPVNKAKCKALASKIIKVFDPGAATNRAAELVLTVASVEVDPWVYVFQERILALR